MASKQSRKQVGETRLLAPLSTEDKDYLESMKRKKIAAQIPVLTEQVMILSKRMQQANKTAERRNNYFFMIALVAFFTSAITFSLDLSQTNRFTESNILLGLMGIIITLGLLVWAFREVDKTEK